MISISTTIMTTNTIITETAIVAGYTISTVTTATTIFTINTVFAIITIDTIFAKITIFELISLLNSVCSAVTFLFIILGCREAVPSVGKLAITTAVFILVGLVLTMAVTFFRNIQSDGAVACMVIGSLVELVGLILFTVLVGKARVKYGK